MLRAAPYVAPVIEVTIHEATSQLPRLIAAAQEGEEVVIADGDIPVARLVPVSRGPAVRTLGWGGPEGLRMSADFDASLDGLFGEE